MELLLLYYNNKIKEVLLIIQILEHLLLKYQIAVYFFINLKDPLNFSVEILTLNRT
jgi:hypothetical protein